MLSFETSDDAAVYKLNDRQAAVLTVDFFTPIVDDPYDFGRIAAANSLSDIYAMGAEPKVVLNLLAMPCKLGSEVIGAILQGANDVVKEAGAVTMGGHTIEDAEPKFGLSCFGLAPIDGIIQNKGAQPGDLLYLTKPLGTGIMSTAFKRCLINEDQLSPIVESMAHLNKDAALAMSQAGAHAATDITGFGLLGHLHELCEASQLEATLYPSALEVFPGCIAQVKDGIEPGKTTSMKDWARAFIGIPHEDYELAGETLTQEQLLSILCDPQTSGGMLIAISPEKAPQFERIYSERARVQAPCIGELRECADNQMDRAGYITITKKA